MQELMSMILTKKLLEKQIKDIKIQKENLKIKLEITQEEFKAEIKILNSELKNKDKEISALNNKLETLTQKLEEANDTRMETMQERIDAAVAKAVAQATAPLVEELTKAHVEIGRLKAIINKDSGNSSKPPSQNGFKKILNSREKSDRPKGGQPGHPGHRLSLPENINELVKKGVVKSILIDHTNGSDEYISRHVIDVEIITTITEHRFSIDDQLPKGLSNEVSYGDNIRAMSVLLLSEGIIAEKRLSEIISGITHGVITVSPATLESFKSQFAKNLENSGELEMIKEDLLNGENMHTDDTPVRSTETVEYSEDGIETKKESEKTSFNLTVRTHSNERSTLLTVNPKKDIEGIKRDGILTVYMGNLSHDHEIKFYNYGKTHSTCGDHLCRDLKGLRDLECIPWADVMRSYMLKMNNHKKDDLAASKTMCDPEVLVKYEHEYDTIIDQGREALNLMRKKELGYDKFNAMLNRLTKYKDCYLLFMRDYKAPFTNSLAERDLRMEKIKQKVSYLFRSWEGAKNHVKIRSFISTAKKRGIDLFLAISNVNNGVSVLE